jgi:hypothetical protein
VYGLFLSDEFTLRFRNLPAQTERLGFRRDHDWPVDLLNNMPNTEKEKITFTLLYWCH